jgi:hypothetical protein
MDEIANAIRGLAEPLWCIFVILWAMLIFKDMGGKK